MKLFSSLLLLLFFQFAQAQNVNFELRSTIPYPGQTLANICGYWQDGKEYALLGASQGMVIVDITDPDEPVQLVQIPMVNNLWKEIKTYKNFAYVTTEGDGGALQIVDLSNLPNTNLPYQTYLGDGPIQNQLSSVHALHIDTTKGFVYLYGSNLAGGGILILDLNVDPYNPTYVGQYNQFYVHDGYVDNDTVYASQIYEGNFRIMDCTDKQNIQIIADQSTPNLFTHNTWLTPDKLHVLSTDETADSYLAAYNIQDFDNIFETDRIQSNPGANAAVHNTHINADYYAITSWYNDGVTIVDCSRPHNLIQVGNYDAGPGQGAGFDGTWGVYPFFPSGAVVLSNIDEGLTVLSPTYQRGCYFEGTVIDSITLLPLFNVPVEILSSDLNANDNSNSVGEFACGQLQAGSFQIKATRLGYEDYTATVTLQNGILTALVIKMKPILPLSLSGIVTENSYPSQNAQVRYYNENQPLNFVSDAAGQYSLSPFFADQFYSYAAKWGYFPEIDTLDITQSVTVEHPLSNTFGMADYFETNQGWTTAGTSPAGIWVLGAPNGTTSQNLTFNPNIDATDWGKECFVTGNSPVGSVGSDDVDEGDAVLLSPSLAGVLDMNFYSDYLLSLQFNYWFANGGGNGAPNDTLKFFLIGDNQDGLANACDTLILGQATATTNGWAQFDSINYSLLGLQSCDLVNWKPLQLMFVAADAAPGHIVEAGIDNLRMSKTPYLPPVNSAKDLLASPFSASPNPFFNITNIDFDLSTPQILQVTDVSGRILQTQPLAAGKGQLELGQNWPAGLYFVAIPGVKALRLVKI